MLSNPQMNAAAANANTKTGGNAASPIQYAFSGSHTPRYHRPSASITPLGGPRKELKRSNSHGHSDNDDDCRTPHQSYMNTAGQQSTTAVAVGVTAPAEPPPMEPFPFRPEACGSRRTPASPPADAHEIPVSEICAPVIQTDLVARLRRRSS